MEQKRPSSPRSSDTPPSSTSGETTTVAAIIGAPSTDRCVEVDRRAVGVVLIGFVVRDVAATSATGGVFVVPVGERVSPGSLENDAYEISKLDEASFVSKRFVEILRMK